MFHDARDVPRDATLQIPVCIAGGGAAGITLARRLAAAGIGVILLESGGFQLEEDTQALYDGEIGGEPYFPLSFSRLRFLGGSTNHWTGWCRPLDHADFKSRSWVPNSGWPITREDLDPYYRLAHQTCELGGVEYSGEYWSQLTSQPLLDLNSERVASAIWQFSPPTRFGERYRTELQTTSNLDVYLHANLVELEALPSGGRVRRLRVASLSGNSFFVEPRVVVLALGAVENARVLLASTGAHPEGLGNERGVVGRYFMEHPHSSIGVLLSTVRDEEFRIYSDVVNFPHQKPVAVRAALVLTEEQIRRDQILGFSLTIEPEVRFPPLGRALQSGVHQLTTDLHRGAPQTLYQLFARTEQSPHRESRVRLGDQRDALGMRRAVLDWHFDALTRRTFTRSMEIMAAALSEAKVGRVYSFCHTKDLYRAGCWPDIMGGHHHMGTTRMGRDPNSSVVNPDCRLHSVENVFLAGSSVFPTSGYANPTLTLVALAHRLADHLKEHAL